jgi:hypothetical protein
MTQILFANEEWGRELLTKKDEYMNTLTDSDLKLRIGSVLYSKLDDPYEEYCQMLNRCVILFTDNEKEFLERVMTKLLKTLKKQGWRLKVPKEIIFIKTDGSDESTCSYCRHNNVIVLIESHAMGKSIIAHELFHIISRNNIELRDKLYNIIGYKVDSDITKTLLDKLDPAIYKNKIVTNPDCPLINVYIDVDDKRLIPITFWGSNYPEEQGTNWIYTDYYETKLLEVKEDMGFNMYNYNQVAVFDYHKIGTDYLEHPEEIMADNFADLMMIKTYGVTKLNSELIVQIENVLKNRRVNWFQKLLIKIRSE